MHGTYEANMAMQHCDVLIAIGARFDDRVIGNPDHLRLAIRRRSFTSTSILRRFPNASRLTSPSSARSKRCSPSCWQPNCAEQNLTNGSHRCVVETNRRMARKDCLKFKQGSDVIMPQVRRAKFGK